MIDRLEVFNKELQDIHNEEIRAWLIGMLVAFPNDGLWTLPAVYNVFPGRPVDETQEGGLLRHTKRVLRVALVMAPWPLHADEDVVIAASILHDIAKWGVGPGCTAKILRNHADLAADWLTVHSNGSIRHAAAAVISAVRAHMARYGTVQPVTNEEKVVALADYVASRYEP